ncbi:M-phase phosphoprotein 8, partial [Stegodyphus mimosarum]
MMVETEPKHFLIQGDVYEVEKLVGVKIVKGKKLYRVRWRGYGKESDTLEPEENLLSCKDMILDLEEKMKKRVEKKKIKKSFRTQTIIKDSQISMPYDSKLNSGATWQATEVQQQGGTNLKDTFWRDFDEGKIDVSDKDMYSKVKERAARTISLNENGKSSELAQKENPSPPLCPKVVLKRKPCNRTSQESLTYKSSLKVKSVSMHIKKRKKYDVLRDYRKRKSRIHRKRNFDENARCGSSFRSHDKADNFNNMDCIQSSSNILQELLINEELKGSVLSDYVSNSGASKSESDKAISSVPKNKDLIKKLKTSGCDETIKIEMRKNQPLMYRITIHDKTKAIYSPLKQGSKTSSETSVFKSSKFQMEAAVKKLFSALLDAVVNNQLEKVARLCTNSHVVNCSQEDGMTALMVAAQLGLYNAAKILLKANAHKDKQNRKGETALMLACKNRHPKTAKLLLEHGANFALTTAEGVTVHRIANQYASETVLQSILVQHIMRIISKFETQARYTVENVAEIKYALFPIQCFSVSEGPNYSINFHHHVKLESPGIFFFTFPPYMFLRC